jgi:lipid II:glycine glycyltransferase (peptidoglycan interpeptide bridge formation enzyme)
MVIITNMQLIQITNKHKTSYTNFINNKDEATCLQMWEWAELRNTLGTKIFHRVGVVDKENRMLLSATYAINQFSKIGNLLYIPQGPIWDNEDALMIFKDGIENIARKNNCFAIICESRIKKGSDKFRQLKEIGFVNTSKAVQPKTTVLLDILRPEKELLKSFSKSTRYNIRYAKKQGVTIKKFMSLKDTDRIDAFYKLLIKTQKRNYFYIQSPEYFRALWRGFSKNNHATLIEAWYKGKLLNSILVLNNNTWSGSLFSASSREHSNIKATYLARWESIKDAKEKGCKTYDFFGATESKNPKHPFYNTTQFKIGFGREFTNFAGTFETIINPIKYNIWIALQKLGKIKFYEYTFLKEFTRRND